MCWAESARTGGSRCSCLCRRSSSSSSAGISLGPSWPAQGLYLLLPPEQIREVHGCGGGPDCLAADRARPCSLSVQQGRQSILLDTVQWVSHRGTGVRDADVSSEMFLVWIGSLA